MHICLGDNPLSYHRGEEGRGCLAQQELTITYVLMGKEIRLQTAPLGKPELHWTDACQMKAVSVSHVLSVHKKGPGSKHSKASRYEMIMICVNRVY